MGDMIRIDPHELTDLSGRLRRLSGEIEEIGAELRLAQYRLSSDAAKVVDDQIALNRKGLIEAGERSEAAARGIMRSAEEFAACERTMKRRMEEQPGVPAMLKDTILREEAQKKQDYAPFTPKNVHSVRMSVSGGDERI